MIPDKMPESRDNLLPGGFLLIASSLSSIETEDVNLRDRKSVPFNNDRFSAPISKLFDCSWRHFEQPFAAEFQWISEVVFSLESLFSSVSNW